MPDPRVEDSSAIPMTRREALATVPAVLAAGAAVGRDAPSKAPPRIAAIVTEYRKGSHAQGIVDRFLDGYGWNGRHHRPGVEIVSLYVDQKPSNDLSEEAREAPLGAEGLSDNCGDTDSRRRSAGRSRSARDRRARAIPAE